MKKILIIIFIFLLCGCYNYKELNKISIVSSISIDKDKDEYLVGAQIMNIKNKDDNESSNINVYEEKGKTIEEALRKITTKTPRQLYGGHMNKLVVSEEVAKEGIINVIDLFQRLAEIKDEFSITIAKGIEANKIIKITTSSEKIPADYVKSTIDLADIDDALTHSSKLDEFVSYYLKKGIDPVISVIEVKDYSPKSKSTDNVKDTVVKTKIIVNNLAITKNGKLVDFLSSNETIGYNFIRNNVKEMIIPIKCDNTNYASISVLNNKTKNTVKKINNKYKINININTKASLTEYNCSSNLTNEKTIKSLEEKTKRKIKKYVNAAINKQKNSESEFLGFKRMIYLDFPKYKKEDFDIFLNINVNISRKGEIKISSKGEKYEHKDK